MNGFFELISGLLNFFYELVPNYAVAIALLTCVVMLATTPLTLKGTRSMIEMQRLQPQIRKLQAQYKDDRQKLNEELMKFYKEHEINPLGGCFPLLIQAPVFSILFYVVRGLTNPYKFTGVQKALADHGIDPVVSEGFRPKYLDHGDELYQALVGQTHMNAFGIDLARSAATALSEGFLTALPYIGLVAVIAGLSWFQQRQIMGRNAGTEITSQQRMMMRLGPAMYVFFAFVSPAAIGVYFLVSTFWRVVQQYYITRSLYRGEDSVGVQAQRAMAEMREARKQDGGKDGSGGGRGGGGGGLLDRLTGGAQAKATGSGSGSGSGKASGSGKGSGSGKAAGSGRDGGRSAAKTTENGSAATRGKAGASNGSRPRSGGGGGGAGAGAGAPSGPSRPAHPRARKKKKRK